MSDDNKGRRTARLLTLVAGLATGLSAAAADSNIDKGREIALERSKGNCIACHMIEGGNSPGNIAPPLVGMKARFPDRAVLKAQILDATVRNPETSMPPFGRNRILTPAEIDQVVDFIWSL
jgi:sulfur-oxidizing protein SoxX